MLIREIFSRRTSFIRRDSKSGMSQKKKKRRYKPLHTQVCHQISASIKQQTPTEHATVNSLILNSCKSHISNRCYLAPFIASLQKESLWQKELIPTIASLALQPTTDSTRPVRSSTVAPYYTSHLCVLLT